MTKFLYSFGGGRADGSMDDRNLLGGKGANLAEMAKLGLPVPPGFTITTEVCTHYYANGQTLPDALGAEVKSALTSIGVIAGKGFGDAADPLLLSVRSGARASMPGMMDTVLNLGLNDETVVAMANASGDERFAWDSYRRFIAMYSDVVLGVSHSKLEAELDKLKERWSIQEDTGLSALQWKQVVDAFKAVVAAETGSEFPQDIHAQLWGAIEAVFSSWMNPRAETYRELHGIPASWGTAVTVQAMVFGNRGVTSATGVAFTRNPSTGVPGIFGEFLVNAQGEDVVAGIRTPLPIEAHAEKESMRTVMPLALGELQKLASALEQHYRDMQDIEFTIQEGKLWLLQTRSGKRTAKAAIRIAVDLVDAGTISTAEAVLRVEPDTLNQLLHPTLDPTAARNQLAQGLPASPGAASGEIVFTSAQAEMAKAEGRPSILVRNETSPEDIKGMLAAEGILTRLGGMTSHAAVVARGWGKPCVSGAGAIKVDAEAGTLRIGELLLGKGDVITIDGGTGEVFAGDVPRSPANLSPEFETLMSWADGFRRMDVRANAETPDDARQAVVFGAEGIGLCRTEHMFFQQDRIDSVREMILADTLEGRRAALAKLLPMQREDFRDLFGIMAGLPVTVRLLDPPLHEFLPHGDAELKRVSENSGISEARLAERAVELYEANPMLGFRGCRLLVCYPEIAEMQTQAMLEAAAEVGRITGAPVQLEIMIPLVATRRELEIVKATIDATAAKVEAETGASLQYRVGTMIEVPRAALRAGELAELADFFSFGTNDLTQTAIGLSRDDAGSYLGSYVSRGVFERDPFVSIDIEGVGELVKIGAKRGRRQRNDIKLGMCGEHAGDPKSIDFCEEVALDYVSCSAFRIPVARLAAAQASIRRGEVVYRTISKPGLVALRA